MRPNGQCDRQIAARWSGSSNGFSAHQNQPKSGGGQRLASGLGWLSLGLGLVQVVAPRRFARWIGVPANPRSQTLVSAVGLREILAGTGLILRAKPRFWLWARVAGDLMDLGLLGASRGAKQTKPNRLTKTAAAVAGVTLVDLVGAVRTGRSSATASERGVWVRRSVTIRRSPDEVYRFWRNFENLPQFLGHLQSVRVLDDWRSHWQTKGPLGKTVEWDAEIVEDRPNEAIAWRSLEGADVENSGRVRFRPAPGGRGTEVDVEIRYNPPGGKAGRAIATLFGDEPGQQVAGDLRRLKQVLETGEVIQSEAVLAEVSLPQRPAQPPDRRTLNESTRT